MVRFASFIALCIALSHCAAAQAVESTPAPPNWLDGQGPSVYMTQCQNGTCCAECNKPPGAGIPSALGSNTQPARYDESAVVPAAYEAPVAVADSNGRRLAPPTTRSDMPSDPSGHSKSTRQMLASALPTQSIYTVVTALAIVIGAFLLFTWAIRRGGSNARNRRGFVPTEAVSVLGRVPLAARQFAELLHVGNKLVLVAMTPSGPTTITEVIDPVEVDRLVGLCQQYNPHSTTKAFEQVFQQLSSEPTSGGFLGGEPLPASLSSAALAYRSQRGAARA
jgi:flagellar biogenesis protein FliO